MCRLLGYVSRRPMTAGGAVGTDEVRAFADLARVHCDGWGAAWVERPGAAPQVRTSERSAERDPAFADQHAGHPAVAGLLHLRWATMGLRVAPENTHPFLADGVAFAHNGSLPADVLTDLLEPAYRAGLRGTTDSERYFALVRQVRATGMSLSAAVRRVVSLLALRAPRASLNALLLDEASLIAVHASAHSTLHPDDTELCRAAGLPQDHLDDYFALRVRRTAEGVQIGSTGFGQAGWEPLPPDSVTTVRLADLSVTTELLDVAAAAHRPVDQEAADVRR
jgi:predicted glutamine amidotransferase